MVNESSLNNSGCTEIKRPAWCHKACKWFSWNVNSSHLISEPVFCNTVSFLTYHHVLRQCCVPSFFLNYLMMFLRISKYYIKITCPLLHLIASKIYLTSFLTYPLHFILFYSYHQKGMRWNLRSKYFTWLNPQFFTWMFSEKFFMFHAYI